MIQLAANGENLDNQVLGKIPEPETKGKEVDFKLIPLFKPFDPTKLMASKCNPLQYEIEYKKILTCWEHITLDMELLEKITRESVNLVEVLNCLLSGGLLLWMGFYEGKYCGFITTRIERDTNVSLRLNVVQCYVKKGINPECFYTGFKQLKEFAISQKCKKISVWANRKGEQKLLEPMGFKQTYIQYDLDLREDN